MKRSKRFEVLDARPVNLDGYISEWPEMGLIAMHSPYDPKPSIKISGGKIIELDGKARKDFDFIDTFIADHAINIQRAPVSMSIPSLEIARKIVDIHRPSMLGQVKPASKGILAHLPPKVDFR